MRRWLPKLAAKKRLDLTLLITAFHLLPIAWQESEVFASFEGEARRRIGRRDQDDWPTVALALALNAPVWTQDKDFTGSGLVIYTTGKLLDALRRQA